MSSKLDSAIQQARILLRQQHSGILSSISVDVAGFPFGSVTPFMLNGRGEVIIYASDIAQHAKNMQANPKVSLCVHDPVQADSQASARVTLLGEACADSVTQADQQRYFRLFPQARAYEQAHDFRFYLIQVTRVRYIGGFGQIFWFSKNNWRQRFVDLVAAENAAIEHMHADHADALQAIGELVSGQAVQTVQMLSIFHDGFHLQLPDKLAFVGFEQSLQRPEQLRQAMVLATKQARQALAK